MLEPNESISESVNELSEIPDRESEEMMHEWQCENDIDILWSKW